MIDGLYGFLVWGKVLAGEFGRYPEIYRPGDDMSAFPLMFAGILAGMIFASWIYAKGYQGGSGLSEGLRFGIVMGLFMAAYSAGVDYGTITHRQEDGDDLCHGRLRRMAAGRASPSGWSTSPPRPGLESSGARDRGMINLI